MMALMPLAVSISLVSGTLSELTQSLIIDSNPDARTRLPSQLLCMRFSRVLCIISEQMGGQEKLAGY